MPRHMVLQAPAPSYVPVQNSVHWVTGPSTSAFYRFNEQGMLVPDYTLLRGHDAFYPYGPVYPNPWVYATAGSPAPTSTSTTTRTTNVAIGPAAGLVMPWRTIM